MSVESHSGITPTDPSFFKKTKKQSVIHAKSTNKDESDVFRSALAKESLLDRLPYARTVQELFMHSVKAFPNNPCLGTRFPINNNTQWSDYQWKTYAEVNQDRLDFGAGLMHLHHQHVGDKSKNWFMGVFAQNRYEWVVADLGAGAYSIATVALYDTLGPETSEFILNHAECPIIVTSIDKVAGLLELSSQCPLLKVIIVMESLNNTSIFKLES
ncbi:hypothetical protein HDV02_001169 [Globomyces sp. JEL0801]|nr:hypothetical protein HDV02_001169 [Globomyces sp. JEL0801]